MKYSRSEVTQFGNILGIWAHPDDEVFAAGGLFSAAVSSGQEVILITATHGSAGKTADENLWPQAKLSEIRKAELDNSLLILGIDNHYWLDYKDGELDKVDITDAVNKIYLLTKDMKIDTIVTFEEYGITGHGDHKAVHKWSKFLTKKISAKQILYSAERQEYYDKFGKDLDKQHNIYFKVDKPRLVCEDDADVCFCLDQELQQKKLTAIKAHESQTAGMFASKKGRDALEEMCTCECFIDEKIA